MNVNINGHPYPVQAVRQVTATLANYHSLAVTGTSASLTVNDSTGQISLHAVGCPMTFRIVDASETAPTVVAGTGHFLAAGGEKEIRVPVSFKIAAIADSGSGTLRISQLG